MVNSWQKYTIICIYAKKTVLLQAKSAKMTILSIETSTSVCSAALSVNGKTIASRIHRDGANHARLLPVYIDELLTELKSRALVLGAVALSEGPGSYTGLRIGASTAKGLCYGYSIPLIPIATTEVLCAALAAKHPLKEGDYLIPMIDARRMEVYTALYQIQNGSFVPKTNITAAIIDSEQAIPFGDGQNYIFGDGAATCKDILSKNADFIDTIVPNAAEMGQLALRYLQNDSTRVSDADIAYYEPFYLKEFIAAKSHVKGLV